MKPMTKTEMKKTISVINEATNRVEAILQQIDPRRDMDDELGYPPVLTLNDYYKMFERDGYGSRVVSIAPKGCWQTPPIIKEDEDSESTVFEDRLKEVVKATNLWGYLKQADILSGIGHYGGLFLGLGDGIDDFEQPTLGIEGEGSTGRKEGMELLYLRALGEKDMTIATYEDDKSNLRFGRPKLYNITLSHVDSNGQLSAQNQSDAKVHWSRIIHLAEGKLGSETHGVPRQRSVFNYLYNAQKIMGGSAEMYWQGAYPGLSIEAVPGMEDAEIDMDSVKKAVFDYQNKLKRAMVLQGVEAKPLNVQIASPKEHMDVQLDGICSTTEVPRRIFLGSERGELASSQDTVAWNGRLMSRQGNYLTPEVVEPTLDRLSQVGVLPEVDEYTTTWDDLNTVTDTDKATVAASVTDAMAKYVTGGVAELMPPEHFLRHVVGLDDEVIEAIQKKVDTMMREEEELGVERQEAIDQGVSEQARADQVAAREQAQRIAAATPV